MSIPRFSILLGADFKQTQVLIPKLFLFFCSSIFVLHQVLVLSCVNDAVKKSRARYAKQNARTYMVLLQVP